MEERAPLRKNYTAQEIAGVLGVQHSGLDKTTSNGRPCIDSRNVGPGDIFIAVPGTKSDGHSFIKAAEENGAALIVYSDRGYKPSVPSLQVTSARRALSQLAAWFYDYPSHDLHTVGVTGTNGKTTIQWIIYQLFKELYGSALRVGTLGAMISDGSIDEESLTTPDAIDLEKYFFFSRSKNVGHAVLEVSSHALLQCRVDDIQFNGVVFSNLSRDHLDYHGTEENYFLAKRKLFELVEHATASHKYAVTCIDDSHGQSLYQEFKDRFTVLGYGSNPKADIRFYDFNQTFEGSSFKIQTPAGEMVVKASYIGEHNARNICAAVGVLLQSGRNPLEITEALAGIPPVPGRLEPVGNDRIGVFVDYAHTPDALDNVLRCIKPLVKGKLWVVFGCGGDRDRGKRPQMGKAAAAHGDYVVVTSDNPRTENPATILEDILSEGLSAAIVEVDRKKAILETLSRAETGDVVVIAGKGHEDYQIIGTEKFHFSDQEIVREFFSAGSK